MEIQFDPSRPRMYADLAWLWPIISPPEDYIAEALLFVDLIRRYGPVQASKPDPSSQLPTLLHLGCGGGHLDQTLQRYFMITGVDLSPRMLDLARRLNPQVRYQLGDMRNSRLGERFDAVMIADSIDYMLSEEELRLAFQTAYEHLVPGGVFVTYAEQTQERFKGNQVDFATHISGDLHVTLVENMYDPDPADSTYQTTLIYLLRKQNESRSFTLELDHHLGGLFPESTWRRLLVEAGFTVYQEEFPGEGFPFFIGLKS